MQDLVCSIFQENSSKFLLVFIHCFRSWADRETISFKWKTYDHCFRPWFAVITKKTRNFPPSQVLGCYRKKKIASPCAGRFDYMRRHLSSDSFTSSHVLLYTNRYIDVSTLVLDEALIYRRRNKEDVFIFTPHHD